MKIMVSTPFDSANFGAYLQAYCLKKHLEDSGHEVVHLRTRSREYVDRLFVRKKLSGMKAFIPRFLLKERIAYGVRKKAIFTKEWEHFTVCEQVPEDADVCILGSDEIWNVRQNAFRGPQFWSGDPKPTIAYAVSAGAARPEEFDRFPLCAGYMRSLARILVRDENTRDAVRHCIGTEPKMVCDPTILVPPDSYGTPCEDPYVKENRCLLVYAYSLTAGQRRAIRTYAASHGLKTVSVCFFHAWCDHQVECGPLAFSSLICQCEAVVTTTFHGSIFCLLNHANYIAVSSKIKVRQLHETVGAEERLVKPDDFSAETLNRVLGGPGDWAAIDQRLAAMRERSAGLLQEALAEAKPGFQYVICPADKCTACYACQAVCPREAIDIRKDGFGRTLPVIDPERCVRCGMCARTCPQRKELDTSIPAACYAAQVGDPEKRACSSSGAIAAVLTERMITEDAVVCGSAGEKDMARHVCATDAKEAEAFRGSKYVQSDMDGIAREIAGRLKKGETVVFFGTPCQVAGVRAAAGKNAGKLYCVDIICHGVPPMAYLQDHIRHIAGGQPVDRFSFRGGKDDFFLKLTSGGKTLYRKDKIRDEYFYAFMRSLSYRGNCYACPYATPARAGDMTIGDFWGLKRGTLKTPMEGRISVVLVNTPKGQELWEKIRGGLAWEERELQEAVDGNAQMRRPSKVHGKRSAFLAAYLKTQDFDAAFRKSGIGLQWRKDCLKQTAIYRGVRKAVRMITRK